MRMILSELRTVVNSCGPVPCPCAGGEQVPGARGGEAFRVELDAGHAVLAERPGYLDGHVGRNLDDPMLWVLTTRWENVGAYRRALSSYEVKMQAVPLLSRAMDEPSAYEVVEPGTVLNIGSTRSLG
jgi:hypothetical protein